MPKKLLTDGQLMPSEQKDLGESFYSSIRSAIEDGYSPEDAVDFVFDNVEFRHQIRQIIVSRLRSMERNETRQAELRAQRALVVGDVRQTKRELIGRSFRLPDGRFVEWTKATAQEHNDRAKWQRQRAASINKDAEFHELAAHVIEISGVTCLGQIKSIEKFPEFKNWIGELNGS